MKIGIVKKLCDNYEVHRAYFQNAPPIPDRHQDDAEYYAMNEDGIPVDLCGECYHIYTVMFTMGLVRPPYQPCHFCAEIIYMKPSTYNKIQYGIDHRIHDRVDAFICKECCGKYSVTAWGRDMDDAGRIVGDSIILQIRQRIEATGASEPGYVKKELIPAEKEEEKKEGKEGDQDPEK